MKMNTDYTATIKNKNAKAKPSPIVIGGMVLIVAMAFWYFYQKINRDERHEERPTPPALLSEVGACPDTGNSALSRANELLEAALAKLDRYPFHAADGVKGYELLQRARSCFVSGNDREGAVNVETKMSQWKRRLEQRYQNHQIRLRLALDREAFADALSETRSLRSLLKGRQGAYPQWLASLEKRLEPIAEEAVKKR